MREPDMAIQQPSATTKAEHVDAAEAALASAYKLAGPNESVDPKFWLSLASLHVGIAGLVAEA